jgi:hypothetical protein
MRERQAFSESPKASRDFGTEVLPVAGAPDVRLAGLASEDFMAGSSVAQADSPPSRIAQYNPDNTDRAFIDESSS